MLSAAVMAEGPGTATTVMPSCATRRTSSNPGSESSGVPASLTSAMRAPARSFSSSSSMRSRLVVFVQRHQRPRQAQRCQQLPRPARVFRRDQFRGGEFLARARRKVAEIADGRRDHRKTPRVRCHYTSPPRLDARPPAKAIRHMTARKSSAQILWRSARRRRDGAAARRLPDHAAPRRTAERRSRRSADARRRSCRRRRRLRAAGDRNHRQRQRRIPAARRARLARRGPRRRRGSRARAACRRGLTQQQALEQTLLRIQSARGAGPRRRSLARGQRACRRPPRPRPPRATTKPASRWPSPRAICVDGIRVGARARTPHRARRRTHRARSELLGAVARRGRTRRFARRRRRAATPPCAAGSKPPRWPRTTRAIRRSAPRASLPSARVIPSHPALAALSGEPGVGIEEPAAQLEAAPHLALMLPLTGRTSAPAAQIRDGFMTAYYQLPAGTRPRLRVYDTRRRSDRRHHGAGGRGRRRVHRRPADARGSGRRRRSPNYPAAGAGAQFPAGRPADAGAVFPVRAFARRRCARGGALHRRQRPPPRRGAHARRRLGHARRRGIRRGTARRRRLRARPGELRQRRAQRFQRRASCRCCAPTTAARASSASRPPSARSSSSSRAAAPTSSSSSRPASPSRRACCARSCVSTSPATSPPTRSAMPTSRTPPPTRKSTA